MIIARDSKISGANGDACMVSAALTAEIFAADAATNDDCSDFYV
jgi:hypothetical protein